MILLLTAADTDLLTLRKAVQELQGLAGPIRAANIRQFQTAAQVEQYCDETIAQARLVILRLLGGKNHFQIGFERIASFCKARGIALIAVPGDQDIDPDLTAVCNVPLVVVDQVFKYLTLGGVENFSQMLRYASDTIFKTAHGFQEPQAVALDGLYRPEGWSEDSRLPTVGIVFYRAHWMSGDTQFVDATMQALRDQGLNARAVFCYSLKHDPRPAQALPTSNPRSLTRDPQPPDRGARERTGACGLEQIFHRYFTDENGCSTVAAVVSVLSYAVAELETKGAVEAGGAGLEFLSRWNVPVFQAIVCSSSREDWQKNPAGISPRDTAMKVVLPEFDGRVLSHVIAFTESQDASRELGTRISRIVPDASRMQAMSKLLKKWVSLKTTLPAQKKLAIILTNFPNKNARIGNAVGLDTPASAIVLLHALKKAGYCVENIPPDGDSLIHAIIDRLSLDQEELTSEKMHEAAGHVSAESYARLFSQIGQRPQQEMRKAWGEPPGNVFLCDDDVYGARQGGKRGALAIPGIMLGNIYVGVQPARGYGENPRAIYHSPDLVPTHHYLAFYRWLREDFGAHALIHLGKHGTLEWLPGKSLALSEDCYPDLILQDMPKFYPFIVNDPGEGTQAKRRAHAVIIDHLIPPMTRAETYDQLAKLEQLMDEYYRMAALDPTKLPLIRQQIWAITVQANLHKDLERESLPEDFDHFLQEMDGYLCEIKDSQIRDGLHVLGQVPAGDQLLDLLIAITRLGNHQAPGLRALLLTHFGFKPEEFTKDLGVRLDGGDRSFKIPKILADLESKDIVARGDIVDRIHKLSKIMLAKFAVKDFHPAVIAEVLNDVLGESPADLVRVMEFMARELIPNLHKTSNEISSLLNGLAGRFVAPGPSGAPTRGMANVLPTGRNFYSVDIHRIPSPSAWETGRIIARELLERYSKEEGKYPETVGTVIWGTSNMRTHGDDIAQMLYLLGVRPKWNLENSRIEGLELISLEELGRPRIDVMARISGFFRDAFPNLVHLLDKAVRMAAAAPEPPEQNYVRKHYLEEKKSDVSGDASLFRLFSSKPGCYGTGLLQVLHEQNWKNDKDLADIYLTWGGYAYSQKEYGVPAQEQFQRRLGQIRVVTQNQDNREHDIFDSDDYFQFHGGMIASIRSLTGSNPKAYLADTSRVQDVKMRSLREEAHLVFRSRVVNPKWIAAMQRHGYKGAFEMAATIDYLFGYDATAHVLEDWMYEKVAQAYLFDARNKAFLEKSNPWAMADMSKRLLEAAQRELWENPAPETLENLRQIALDAEAVLEGRVEDKEAVL